jgi:transcriptional regulator with XRE-family HTH domain
LAKKVDLSKSEISRIENGKRETKLAMLKKIAIEIGVTASSLLDE